MKFTNKQKKAIFFTVILILLLILVFIIIVIGIINKSIHMNQNIDVSTGYSSIRDIIEHYESKYISEVYDLKYEYPTMIKVEFKYDLYENEEINEKFFNDIINDVARFLNFTNFSLTDEKKNIKIEVKCENRQIVQIKINGIEDYFIYIKSQLDISKYKEIEVSDLIANSKILQDLISNAWNSNMDFGTRDSIFQNYFIFFDEGIEYKKIGSCVYNIVFTRNYRDYVLNNLTTSDSFNSVIASLGEPTFEDKKLNVIGYKGNDFYAFFTEGQISIYKNIKTDYTEFWKLADKFISQQGGMTFKEFMNELTYIWIDYSEYTYEDDVLFVSYPNKGVDIKLNVDGVNGIVLYNNISDNMNRVQRYLEYSEFISNLKLDNVFEAEKRRLQNNNNLPKLCAEYKEYMSQNYSKQDLEMIKESILCDYYLKLDDRKFTISAFFIPKDKLYVRRELNESIYKYLWIDSEHFLYSIMERGIFIYNILTGERKTIIEGNDTFDIKSYDDNNLNYDKKSILIQVD